MKQEIYAIFDSISKALYLLFTAPNAMTATRSFAESVKNKNFGPATKDVELYKVGEIKNDGLEIKAITPICVEKAANFGQQHEEKNK